MKKRMSKRRWKRRCERGGYAIPLTAIVEHRLDRWFRFEGADNCEIYFVIGRVHP